MTVLCFFGRGLTAFGPSLAVILLHLSTSPALVLLSLLSAAALLLGNLALEMTHFRDAVYVGALVHGSAWASGHHFYFHGHSGGCPVW